MFDDFAVVVSHADGFVRPFGLEEDLFVLNLGETNSRTPATQRVEESEANLLARTCVATSGKETHSILKMAEKPAIA
jgi:hypothetical protein